MYLQIIVIETKSPILIDLLTEFTREELNVEEESAEPKNCTCTYHADYDKPQNLNLPAVVSPNFKWEKQLKFLQVITWLKSCIKRESNVSADEVRSLVKQFSTTGEPNLEKKNEPIILKIKKRSLEKEEEDDCEELKDITNSTTISNHKKSKKKRVKKVKKSVLPEEDLEASQCSPLVSFGEDSIPKSFMLSPINSVADSGIDIETFISSYLLCQFSNEEANSQNSHQQTDYISFFKQPDGKKILESPKQDYTISSDQLMLIHEQCQLDDFALTVVRDFLNEFNSEKVFENIFKNKALIVESFQTIGDFVNHLERREKNNITITHFFIKIIMSTIKKAFDASVHNNLTNFKAQLYVSMVLELNKSLKTIKETLDFLITQLFDSLVDASQCVDIRLKRSIERHEYIILYGLEITIKKFCEMISCEMVKTKLQDSSTKITAFWRRQLIAHFDPTFNEPRVIPEDDLKEFLIISLKKLLGTYKSMNPLKAEWVLKLICLLSNFRSFNKY
ncbi:Protein of unknown function [Cotesia congregata]|uniref:Uncharacterized protein n=1 Tax=Cotesia congregata TaxID=51543 RepID=A0A8J2MY45_COTCN|nr:Protein of unknown function [Cotesia congregata]